MTRDRLLFYCQHSLGLGHLARSLRLAGGLADRFDVVLLNGGRLPAGTAVPGGVRLVNLPPLGLGPDGQLVSHDPALTVEQAQFRRRDLLLATLAATAPRVLVVELYPFGRRRFEFELVPLLAAAHETPDRPRVVCSLRDILVHGRADQHRHDERTVRRANRWLDAVLVHADPGFATLADSFRPATPLRVPVHYTGFVAPAALPPVRRARRLLVSAGGGMVGEPLVRAAVEVHVELAARTGLATTVVAGPFLPEPVWAWLAGRAAASPALTAVRSVPDLGPLLRGSAVSLSQGGYNTAMDLLRAGTPAVVVPYGEGAEDEQSRRTARLADLGVLRMLPAAELTADRLLAEVSAAAASRPGRLRLDLSGVSTSTRVLAQLAAQRGATTAGTPEERGRTRREKRTQSWLDPVRAALDRAPATVFFRDDDAGWDDARLRALLAVFDRRGVPLDVAVIPAELTERLAADLRARARAGAIRLHQHGYAHVNHEPAGRKHEFGPARTLAEQSADIARGRSRLTAALGDLVDPIFTPPWNRCTADTAAAMIAAGLRILSRDRTAGTLGRPDLTEVPISVDWFAHRKGVRLTRRELGAALATHLSGSQSLGLMLHHAVSTPADLAALDELLALVATHPASHLTTITAVAAAYRTAGPADDVAVGRARGGGR